MVAVTKLLTTACKVLLTTIFGWFPQHVAALHLHHWIPSVSGGEGEMEGKTGQEEGMNRDMEVGSDDMC